jgi:hypothetical protein
MRCPCQTAIPAHEESTIDSALLSRMARMGQTSSRSSSNLCHSRAKDDGQQGTGIVRPMSVRNRHADVHADHSDTTTANDEPQRAW